uniref:Uncharacterized protein n=1 Tax=Pithovirus LCPAC304 TaxID=2506594 RepID=A0A481Z7G3_9VIRU|nr:MAG: hypothetical protein LCPAC304_01510 [Pithovirus LCPAC304]
MSFFIHSLKNYWDVKMGMMLCCMRDSEPEYTYPSSEDEDSYYYHPSDYNTFVVGKNGKWIPQKND